MIKVGSLLTQVLSLTDRGSFGRAVRQWDAERAAKGFRCWDQFVAMVFCQLGGADSLREISGGLSTALGKLVHLGLQEAPSRSTLSYANQHRPWQLFQTVFEQILAQADAFYPSNALHLSHIISRKSLIPPGPIFGGKVTRECCPDKARPRCNRVQNAR